MVETSLKHCAHCEADADKTKTQKFFKRGLQSKWNLSRQCYARRISWLARDYLLTPVHAYAMPENPIAASFCSIIMSLTASKTTEILFVSVAHVKWW